MKKLGIQPIPMMDRDKKDEVPQGQVWIVLQSPTVYSGHNSGYEWKAHAVLQDLEPPEISI